MLNLGGQKPWLNELMKSSGQPSLIEPPAAIDPLLSWRRSLEQSLLLPNSSQAQPLGTPSSTYPPTPSPHSPTNLSATSDRGPTPMTDSKSPPPSHTPVTTNGMSKPSMTRDEEVVRSPFKPDETMFPLPSALMHHTAANMMSASRIPKSDPMEGALQDMLRYNMEKYAGQALDTVGAARRVRELLSVHNIGQRLFAKYVLGLSQGTVSELLSKPKTWEKLTEKGRDSYRKMHAWAFDDNAILMLKSLIPRKGELSRQTRIPFVPHQLNKEEFPGEPQLGLDHMKGGPKPPGDPFLSRYPFPAPMGDAISKIRIPTSSPTDLVSHMSDL